jgi:hypothetical protein
VKKITYKFNEQKALISAMLKDNPEHTKEYMKKIITEAFQDVNNNQWEDYTINVKIENRQYYNEFVNNRTGEKSYDHCKLPVTIREVYNRLFTKLYRQYCN